MAAPPETTTPPVPPESVTAALIIVGNEILSGRTQDTNLNYLAKRLGERGIRLVEARVIADHGPTIQAAVNALRVQYDYVFTTGGIGPTHDDITAENVAAAFAVPLIHHPEAVEVLRAYYGARDQEVTEARLRMARTPEGAVLIDNPVSGAPGFCMDNVYVMAGVPKIMQGMLEGVLPDLKEGLVTDQQSIACDLPESVLSGALTDIQAAHPSVDIGSYPGLSGISGPAARSRVSIVVRGTDAAKNAVVIEEVKAAILQLNGQIVD